MPRALLRPGENDMDIQKPDTLFCATQPLDWRGAPHHAFSVLLGLDMRTGGVLAADAALTAAMQALPSGCRLDVGIPKQEAEWLLAGVVTPRAREGAVVEIRVGRSRRRFLVAASPDGAPVPLIWEKTAFDSESNPLGSKSPQISDPALPHGAPACPLPLGAWPCRMKNMGTYDARWLKTRWPGLPDDADWRFFNEAQPQQRLPDGLRGDEEIILAGFFDDVPERRFRLPGARLRFEILRRADNVWKEHAARADTLWLFPGQHTALLYWHALVPCADEAASDIAAARFHLSPDTLENVPPPAPPQAPSADVADAAEQTAAAVSHDMDAATAATAAGMAAAAAAATAAAASGAQGSKQSAASADTPSSPASGSASSASSPTPTSAASETPTFSPAAFSAALREGLAEELPGINAALADAGLPPLSPEQIAETHRHIDALSATLAKMDAAPPPPSLEEQLRQAGIPEERIAAVNAALDLELPDPLQHTDSASWQAASDAFLARFSALLQPDENLRASMSQMLQLLGPDGEKQLKALAGDMPDSPQGLLQKAGMRPDNAERLLTMLEQAPDNPDELDAYAGELELAAGFPPGSISEHLRRYRDALRGLEGQRPAAPESPSLNAPDKSGATSASESDTAPAAATSAKQAPHAAARNEDSVSEAETATEDTATTDSAAPPSRAAVMALLASGASLAGAVLAGADLSGLRFDRQNLTGADLSGAKLRGASFVDADLSEASLQEADAADAVFLRARLDKARLRQFHAADADFTGASLAGTDAQGADFSGASFQESRAADLRASDAVFANARLRNADFSGSDLSGARLTGADMHALKLDKARLSGANLADASLSNGTQAPAADFSGATLTGSVWSGVAAPQAVFQRASADNGSFIDCDFTGASWDAVRARHADFTRCSLRGASLQRADLFEASLREARLHAADVRNANLYGADLYRLGTDDATRLDGAQIARTILAARGK